MICEREEEREMRREMELRREEFLKICKMFSVFF